MSQNPETINPQVDGEAPGNAPRTITSSDLAKVNSRTNQELRHKYPGEHSLGNILAGTADSISSRFEGFQDRLSERSWIVDPTVFYYGQGSLTILPRLGDLVFSKFTPGLRPADFKVSASDQEFKSEVSWTKFGSKDINTSDGLVLNPLGDQHPSAPFLPRKLWLQTFPLSVAKMGLVFLLESITAELLRSLDGETKPRRKTANEGASRIVDLVEEHEDYFLSR